MQNLLVCVKCDRVPRDVIWWAMRKLGIDEWLVRLVQSMYKDVRSRVRVGSGYSEEFGVKVGVHQGSVPSPLLFIIVLEALSREFRTGCPWELLCADDLMISAESMEELLVKLLPPPHQPQSATFDQRSSVFNLCEKCNAACGRNMGHDCGYT